MHNTLEKQPTDGIVTQPNYVLPLQEFVADRELRRLSSNPSLHWTERESLARGLRRRLGDATLLCLPKNALRKAERRQVFFSEVVSEMAARNGWVLPSTDYLRQLAGIARSSLPESRQRELLHDRALRTYKTAPGAGSYVLKVLHPAWMKSARW